MRSAAHRAEATGPDAAADLAATLAQLRRALRKPGNSPAVAAELADIGVTLAEIRGSVERLASALALADRQVELGRQIERAARDSRLPVPAPRPRKAGQMPLLRVLPG